MKITVVYGDKMFADTGPQDVGAGVGITPSGAVESPSARKPREMAAMIKSGAAAAGFEPVFVEPLPLSRSDLKLCHDPKYVDDVLDLRVPNGFGTKSKSVADSLPYTNGAMYDAALRATPAQPAVALCSGFHHAGYAGYDDLGYFCTFNGLVVAALKIITEAEDQRVAIIDCDYHEGNGTDDILSNLPLETLSSIRHFTFGKYFREPEQAKQYLNYFEHVESALESFKPSVIIYQSGADVHVDDPYGGMLDESQMYARDLRMFKIARRLGVPIAWNLAGGYQVEQDGSIGKVLNLHMNTFKACVEAYS